jgi:hypothetical protein
MILVKGRAFVVPACFTTASKDNYLLAISLLKPRKPMIAPSPIF